MSDPLQWEVWEFHGNVKPVRTAYINAPTYDEAKAIAAEWELPVKTMGDRAGEAADVPCVVLCVVKSAVSDTFHAWPAIAPPAPRETRAWLDRIKDHKTRRQRNG